MNPLLIYNLWSYRKELLYVSLAFLIILSLPVIAVFLLTNAGIDVISDKLATVNSQTQGVDIHDPGTGKIVKHIQATTTWPTKGVITLEFGQSDWPFQPFHSGIDIANPDGKIGDQVTAFMPGKVIYAGEIFWGFGKHIIIDNGNYVSSIYAHLSKIFVVQGETITSTTQVIGLEGSTGWSTGPHLHFQVNVFGLPVNPRTFLGSGGPN